MTFYSNIEAITQIEIMKNFWNKEIKILIYTDTAGMDVNIPNIIYVI